MDGTGEQKTSGHEKDSLLDSELSDLGLDKAIYDCIIENTDDGVGKERPCLIPLTLTEMEN